MFSKWSAHYQLLLTHLTFIMQMNYKTEMSKEWDERSAVEIRPPVQWHFWNCCLLSQLHLSSRLVSCRLMQKFKVDEIWTDSSTELKIRQNSGLTIDPELGCHSNSVTLVIGVWRALRLRPLSFMLMCDPVTNPIICSTHTFHSILLSFTREGSPV